VNVRFAIGHHDDLVAAQLSAQQAAQSVRTPFRIRAPGAPVFVVQVLQPRAQVRSERRKLGRRRAQRAQQSFAAQQRANARNPATPAQLRDHHGDDRDGCAERGDHDDQVPACVLSPALDRAHVAQQQ